MKRPPALRHPRPAVAVEALECRRLLAGSMTVHFDSSAYVGNLTDAAASVTIVREGDLSSAATVGVMTYDGTAVAGVDYDRVAQTVAFPPDAASESVLIPIHNRGLSGTETRTFSVGLSNPTGLALDVPVVATVTLAVPTAVTATYVLLSTPGFVSTTPGEFLGNQEFGYPVTVTARVIRSSLGIGTPTGTVTFSVDGEAQPPVATTANGLIATAQFTASKLAVGPHRVTAVYSGDASSTPSTASSTEHILTARTSINLVTSADATALGQPLTVTAYVAALNPATGTPTGAITFNFISVADIKNNVQVIPVTLAATVALVPSPTIPGLATAQFTTSTLARGEYEVGYQYKGDATFASNSGGASQVQSIGDLTTTTLSTSAGPSVAGRPVTLTAVVTTTGPASGLPGHVIFSIDNVPQYPVPTVPSPTSPLQVTAQLITMPLSTGSHVLTAVYYSSSLLTAQSSSAPLFLQTGQTTAFSVPTRTVVTTTPSVPTVGRPYVVIATITGAAPLPTPRPTGVAEFLDRGAVLATVPLDANGQAVLYIPSLAKRPHSFTVVYGGDANDGVSVGVISPSIVGVRRASPANTLDVVIDFGGGPLDPTSARNMNNYRITGPNGRSIKVRSATYDATASSVTLRLASRLNLRSTYQLQVIGTGPSGVRGANGSLLAGAGAGLAGTNYQAAINSSTPVRPKVQVQPRATTTHPQGRLAAQLHASTRPAHAPTAR